MMTEEIFLFGASGHAKVIIDAIERASSRIVFVFDDDAAKHGKSLMGYPIIGGRAELLRRLGENRTGVVSIGDNRIRAEIAEWLVEQDCSLRLVVHPSAVVGRDVEMGDGTVVMAGVVINSGARVGRNVIVNTGSTIDHDCEVADGAHVGPGSHLCGHVSIGECSLVGAGTTIVPGVRVGATAVIGAGSVVLRDVADGARVAGNPCRVIAKS